MLASELRDIVYRANRQLAGTSLVVGTFGNVSAVDRGAGLLVIKPSGVPYDQLTPAHMVPVSLDTGAVLEGDFRPSSDTPTHLELYRAFPSCGGIVHTHSEYATVFAQARRPIRCMGTTHADYFRGDVPVTRAMSEQEIESDYEKNTGLVIVEAFVGLDLSPSDVPAVLVANHGPFTWGADPFAAIEYAGMLEYVAKIEWRTCCLTADARRPDNRLIDKHYFRKHGPAAYYGQKQGS